MLRQIITRHQTRALEKPLVVPISLLFLLIIFSPIVYTNLREASAQSSITGTNTTQTPLTYQNPDFGIKMQYPSNWTKQEIGLLLHTVAAFQLLHENVYDFTNTTLAEVDLRIYNAPANETSAKLSIKQIYTGGQTIVKYYKNDTTTLGGLPAIKIISYYFGDITQKEMQIWTFIPSKNILAELIYIASPPEFSHYMPVVQKMIDSVKISN